MKKNLKTMEYNFNDYLSVRAEIDKLSERLEKQHSNHMKCKAGCDMCCMDYSVLPIEFYSIVNALKSNNIKPLINSDAKEEDCIFLNNHRCMIYEDRPIICRTHGLPLLFMSDEGNWELSACELNFTEFDMEQFSEENTFPQDKFNSKVFMLNKKFVQEFSEIKYGEFDLIPLKKLKEYF